ncbi:MAG: potassium-transporting ATPase subunit KdpC [Labilithrix sp.]|nr:potassium-transporting ATPase subunit KdpC [Labilithrix sp.]
MPEGVTDARPPPTVVALASRALGMFAVLTLVTGLVYPLLITAAAAIAFPEEAGGSLIVEGGRVAGSRLVGQPFEDPRYFWGRPSATKPVAYNAGASAGSNLGPTSAALHRAAARRVDALRASDPQNAAPVPVDLVTSSASGLDPHITPAAAFYQAARVARARGIDEGRVRELVRAHVEGRTFGVLGEPRVNVLSLNRALDALAAAGSRAPAQPVR